MKSINPYNGKTLHTFQQLRSHEVNAKIEAAHQQFKDWRKTPYEHRKKLMLRA